jgi:cytoplasmic iron level regulating protein YaaA (DUF328/UPF0246 family)
VLILLPPSEGKTAPLRGAALDLSSLASPELTVARTQVLEALVTFCESQPDEAMAVLGIPKTQPELVKRNASLLTSPTARAAAIYTGVLYDALDWESLSSAAKRRGTSRLRVASSLFGLVSPADRIPAYRLSGDTMLPGLPGPGGIQAHWRTNLEPAVFDTLGNGLLVDLRSGTYAAFWKPTAVATKTATVRVLHEVNGKRSVVSHFNKATKGRIVRALLEDGANPSTPLRLADTLRDLGWTVEVSAPGKAGTNLDVVVSEL